MDRAYKWPYKHQPLLSVEAILLLNSLIVILKVITDKFTIPDVQARANSWLGSGVREEKVFTISYAGQPSAFRFKRICSVVQSFLYIQIEEGI